MAKPLVLFRHLLLGALVAVGATAQSVQFAVNSGLGSSGLLCNPTSCTPSSLQAATGFPVQLMTQGGVIGSPSFLLLSHATAPCVAVPGFAGALLVQSPGLALPISFQWAHFHVSGAGGAVCGGWIGFVNLPLPPSAPSGSSMAMQLLSESVDASMQPVWTFSNVVVLTIQ